MEKKILTVGIPTFNRPNELEIILKKLMIQSNQDFYVLISDDSTNNSVEILCKEYLKKMNNLIYHKNEKNLGFSSNVLQLYELNKTEYIWFLCDDDEISDNAIDDIINSLKKYNPSVAVFNYSWVDSYGALGVAGVKEDKVYYQESDCEDYSAIMRLTFLSILVFKKLEILDEIKKTNYKNNVFVQITIGFKVLEKEFVFCEIGKNILFRNVGFKYGEIIKFQLIDPLRSIFQINHIFENNKFREWFIKYIPSYFLLRLSQKLGMFIFKGTPSKETLKDLFKYYGLYGVLILILHYAYYLIPGFVVKLLFFTKLIQIHGFKEAKVKYKQLINRANIDKRDTLFTTYR